MAVCATIASAQTYTVTTATATSFGIVASASTGVTTFRLDAATSAVTVVSGSGSRVSGSTSRSTVTIKCVDGSGASRRCSTAGNLARIKVGSGSASTGRAGDVSAFTVQSGTGSVASQSTNGDGSIEFTLSGWTANNQSKTFFLGMDLPIDGNDGGATGAATARFYVRAAKNPTTPTTGITANATATVRRSLSVAKLGDLDFGTIVRPASNSGSVTVDATTGARTAGGTTPPGLVTAAAGSRASYLIVGEPGTTIAATVPSTFTMSSGTHSLTVTTSRSATGALTLADGTFTLGVGGTVPIASTTSSGAYSGSFSVTFTYN